MRRMSRVVNQTRDMFGIVHVRSRPACTGTESTRRHRQREIECVCAESRARTSTNTHQVRVNAGIALDAGVACDVRLHPKTKTSSKERRREGQRCVIL